MTTLDLRALLALLVEHEVEFVAVGAVAVAAHGTMKRAAGRPIDQADLDNLPET